MSVHYVDKQQPLLGGYEVESTPEGYRWIWRETAKGVEYTDYGPWRSSEAAAWRDAADDWESNGNSSNRRFPGNLRATATRLERSTHA